MNDRIFYLMHEIMKAPHSEELEESYQLYRRWYYEEHGIEALDTEQLKWILLNPEISNLLKQMLILRISSESKKMEDEKKVLLRAGGLSSEEYADYIEEHTKSEYDCCHNSFKLDLILAAIMSVFFIFLMVTVWSEPSKTLQFLAFLFCMFTITLLSIFISDAIEMWRKANNATHNTECSRHEQSGYSLQERIVWVEERERWLDELCEAIEFFKDSTIVTE